MEPTSPAATIFRWLVVSILQCQGLMTWPFLTAYCKQWFKIKQCSRQCITHTLSSGNDHRLSLITYASCFFFSLSSLLLKLNMLIKVTFAWSFRQLNSVKKCLSFVSFIFKLENFFSTSKISQNWGLQVPGSAFIPVLVSLVQHLFRFQHFSCQWCMCK